VLFHFENCQVFLPHPVHILLKTANAAILCQIQTRLGCC